MLTIVLELISHWNFSKNTSHSVMVVYTRRNRKWLSVSVAAYWHDYGAITITGIVRWIKFHVFITCVARLIYVDVWSLTLIWIVINYSFSSISAQQLRFWRLHEKHLYRLSFAWLCKIKLAKRPLLIAQFLQISNMSFGLICFFFPLVAIFMSVNLFL